MQVVLQYSLHEQKHAWKKMEEGEGVGSAEERRSRTSRVAKEGR